MPQYLCFSPRGSNLAELHAALIQDSLKEQLEESVPAGLESSLTQFPVCRDELCDHRAGLLKALHPGCARVPILRTTGRKSKNIQAEHMRINIRILKATNEVKLSF